MRKVIGIGETILDIIFKENVPQKAIAGGSVFNGLVSLGRLGASVSFISEVGNDYVGDMLRSFMEENNISTAHVDSFSDGKSPVSLAFLDKENNANYMFYKAYPEKRLQIAMPTIEPDDIVVFGSYYALNPAIRSRVATFLQYAVEQKAILYYDPNFRRAHAHELPELMPALLKNFAVADIIRGSDEDFHCIYQEKDLDKVYNDYIKPYCKHFITTLGADGVTLYNNTEKIHFEVDPIQTVSTIGAGDNFNAGIIYGLLKYNIGRQQLATLTTEEWAKVIRCGTVLAAAVCQSYDNYISNDFAKHKDLLLY